MADEDHERPDHEGEATVPAARTRGIWWAVAITLLLLVALLTFILQNTHRVRLRFLWIHFSSPAGVAILFAAVAGTLVVFLLNAIRAVQLRLAARRLRRRQRR